MFRIQIPMLFFYSSEGSDWKVLDFILCYTDGQGEQTAGSVTKDGLELKEGIHIEDATAKQLYILLCSEKALYVYSFAHAVQVMCSLLLSLLVSHEWLEY